MQNASPEIKRLGIPAYNWWNECLHGVARSGDKVTVFPQAIAMAAAFDPEAMLEAGNIIAREARAIYNEANRTGHRGEQYKGLTFWSPNVNIFRDPRWGRGQETYGEDPWLSGVLGKAFVQGIQGNDSVMLKASACAKHFAVHSGPEYSRHIFDAECSDYDLWDTYLPAFRTLVKEARVSSVMGAYNRFRGQPCCANDLLMTDILRNTWGFKGYVTSDCGAIDDFFKNHKTHKDGSESAADAVLHGTDVDCGSIYSNLTNAVKKGLIDEQSINKSLSRLLEIRFRLGVLDPMKNEYYASVPYSVLEMPGHKAHALKMARESIVLLKNNGVLPLDENMKLIAVMGVNADNAEVQLGNYNGFPSETVTLLEGIRRRTSAEVLYLKASDYTGNITSEEDIEKTLDGVEMVIYAGGISPRLEGEEGDAGKGSDVGFHAGDRTSIMLPGVQTEIMKRIKEAGKKLVFVSMSGSALAFPWEAENADAILQAWYGGESAGTAIADILWGDYNPSGRLPVTFYANDSQLPDFENYSMKGRTYRYFEGKPLYPFGYGLSYSSFSYSKPEIESRTVKTGEGISVDVNVTNIGQMTGDEVVQLYVIHPDAPQPKPICSLKGIRRISLLPGETKTVRFFLSGRDLALVQQDGSLVSAPGRVQIHVSGCKPDGNENKNYSIVKLKGGRIVFPK